MKNWCTPLIALGLLTIGKAYGQTAAEMLEQSYDQNYRIELTTGLGKGININSLQGTKFFWIGDQNIFNLGSGMRFSNVNLMGMNLDATGANTTGLKTLKTDGNLYSMNIMFSAEFSYKGQFCIGANTDFFGILFGSVTPDPSAFTPNSSGGQKERKYMPLGGKVPGLNYNLFGGGNHGTTTSEIYGGMLVSRNIWVKAGFARVNNEMTLSQALDQYNKSSNMLIAGIRIRY